MVEVPAIIDAKLWDATRHSLDKNRGRGGGNVKRDYSLRGHVVCGNCKARMVGVSNFKHGRCYSYYVCRIPRVGTRHGSLSYPVELVDQMVWSWVRQLLLDPQAIRDGLAAYKCQQEEHVRPISLHVSAISDLLIEKRTALQRLLDLYLSGEFHKDMLIDKKSELEKAIGEQERERAGLLASMRAQTITDEEEQTLIGFARKVSEGLRNADMNFKTRRDIIEALGVEVILKYEEGTKSMQVKCILGQEYYVLSPNILDDLSDNPL